MFPVINSGPDLCRSLKQLDNRVWLWVLHKASVFSRMLPGWWLVQFLRIKHGFATRRVVFCSLSANRKGLFMWKLGKVVKNLSPGCSSLTCIVCESQYIQHCRCLKTLLPVPCYSHNVYLLYNDYSSKKCNQTVKPLNGLLSYVCLSLTLDQKTILSKHPNLV